METQSKERGLAMQFVTQGSASFLGDGMLILHFKTENITRLPNLTIN